MDKLIDIRNHNMLVFDIETTMAYARFSELEENNPVLADEFKKKFEKEYAELEVWQSVYEMKAPLTAEYGKVISCSFTPVRFESGEFSITTKSFMDHDEKTLLKKIAEVFSKTGWYLAGMNLGNFDIPFLCKRMAVHDMMPSANLIKQCFSKPWERAVYDIAEVWAFGGFKSTKLGAICAAIGIDTPKDGISGPQVPKFYWTGKCEEVYPDQTFDQTEALSIIDEYCQKDTVATANCIIKINTIIHG